jgi:hypothetical protein
LCWIANPAVAAAVVSWEFAVCSTAACAGGVRGMCEVLQTYFQQVLPAAADVDAVNLVVSGCRFTDAKHEHLLFVFIRHFAAGVIAVALGHTNVSTNKNNKSPLVTQAAVKN